MDDAGTAVDHVFDEAQEFIEGVCLRADGIYGDIVRSSAVLNG